MFEKQRIMQDEKVIEINSVTEFLNKIQIIYESAKNNQINNVFYRGESSLHKMQLPGIFRIENFYIHERDLLHEITALAPQELYSAKSNFDKLTLVQHHQLPTRILDVTVNPLVALYFATEKFFCEKNKSEDKDGSVTVYLQRNDNDVKYSNSDTVAILSALPFMSHEDILKLVETCSKLVHKSHELWYKTIGFNSLSAIDKNLKEYNKINTIALNKAQEVQRLYHIIREDIGDFMDKINAYNLFDPLFVIPQQFDSRIIRQSGAFLIVGLPLLESERYSFSDVQSYYDKKLTNKRFRIGDKPIRFIIPNSSKITIQKELNRYAINRATIYPDLDNKSIFIRSSYEP